jgi:hypothetical protein
MTALTERQPRTQDVEALIGLLAVLEAEIRVQRSGTIGVDVDRLRDRLARVGLLDADADVSETALALGNINQRLRYVAGEYETEDEGIS